MGPSRRLATTALNVFIRQHRMEQAVADLEPVRFVTPVKAGTPASQPNELLSAEIKG